VTIWLARARYDDGSEETYQLPLVAYDERMEGLDHVLVGTLAATGLGPTCDPDGPSGPLAGHSASATPVWVYDALHDKSVTAAWLTAIRDRIQTETLQFELFAEPDEIPVDEPSLVSTAEQSNTSLIYGDVAMLKVFRRLQPGINPDIEVHAALRGTGCKHVAQLLGSAQATIDGAPCSLAMLQEFLTSATDGWELAKASVRDLMAEADLHAAEAGGDFAAEAHRLGVAVAEVHADLVTAFGTVAIDADAMRGVRTRCGPGSTHAVSIVPELEEFAPAWPRLSTPWPTSAASEPGPRCSASTATCISRRCCGPSTAGDHRLRGRADGRHADRRVPDFVTRDIAGMLRSFDYVAFHRVVEAGLGQQLTYRANQWSQRNRRRVLRRVRGRIWQRPA